MTYLLSLNCSVFISALRRSPCSQDIGVGVIGYLKKKKTTRTHNTYWSTTLLPLDKICKRFNFMDLS